MSRGGRLAGFDIPGIQRYVFAPVRPMDIMGGSLLLEDFAREAQRIGESLGMEVIYAGGGRGLFHAARDEQVAEFQARLCTRLYDLTQGAVQCVTAAVSAAGEFAEVDRAMGFELRNARASLWLDAPTDVLIPAGTRPQEICRACGLELADREDRVGSGPEQEQEWIGPQCGARRERGRREGFPEIQDLLGPDDAVLACVYLDADRLGATLRSVGSFDELGVAAEAVRDAVRLCRERAARALGQSRLLMPVVGGDDLLFFCSAARAPQLLEDLWAELDQALELWGRSVRFSAVLVMGPYALPLRLFFRTAQRALKEAKRRSYRSHEPHVQVESLMEGWLHAGAGPAREDATAHEAAGSHRRGVFDGPLPRTYFWRGAPSIRRLLAALDEVGTAQRAGLAEDLMHESAALRDLMLDERAARGGEAALQALAEARRLAEALGRNTHTLMFGALAVSTIWGGRR